MLFGGSAYENGINVEIGKALLIVLPLCSFSVNCLSTDFIASFTVELEIKVEFGLFCFSVVNTVEVSHLTRKFSFK